MGNFQTLKNQAAVIRDEQNDYKNTATRVGSMFVGLLEQLEKVLPDENVKPDTLSVEATNTSYILKFTTVDSAGTTKNRELSLPLASDDKAGIMSPALMKDIKDQLTELNVYFLSHVRDTASVTEIRQVLNLTLQIMTDFIARFSRDKRRQVDAVVRIDLSQADGFPIYFKDIALYGWCLSVLCPESINDHLCNNHFIQ